ncbi:thioredoxin domain-containing protein [Humidisolicoccus flavus]|uniref:DsbA family protein n=1 Tax=Humidisolicoccus flavus TaxID=3111414 RepID=UPI00324B035D
MRRPLSLAAAAIGVLALSACIPTFPSGSGNDSGQSTNPSASVDTEYQGPANSATGGVSLSGDGVVLSDPLNGGDAFKEPSWEDVPHVVTFVDPHCPHCKTFEDENGEELVDMAESGKITYEVRVVSFMDGASPNQYSSRAANALSCVASFSPNSYFDFLDELFDEQPSSGSGLSDDELIDMARDNGVDANAEFTACVTEQQYTPWVEGITAAATTSTMPLMSGPIEGTPNIFVNGEKYTGSVDSFNELETFIQDQQ